MNKLSKRDRIVPFGYLISSKWKGNRDFADWQAAGWARRHIGSHTPATVLAGAPPLERGAL